MKRLIIFAAVAASMLTPIVGSAQNSGLSSLGKILEGVFKKSDLDVSDLTGEWTVDGSAVTFKSENLLQKAGGAAVASTVENKIDPYFNKLGLKGAVMTINADGSFVLKSSRISIDGTFTKNSDGTFAAKLNKGKVPLGTLTAYIEKTSQTMDVMFDASKLQKVVSALSSMTGNSTINLANSVLSSYDGICVGIAMKKTGSSATTSGSETTTTDSQSTKNSGLGSIIDILKSRNNR